MLRAMKWRAALLVGIIAGCLGASPIGATATPIVLPSLHPIATDKTITLALVPPQRAKVCSAQIGRGGHSGRRFPVELGGPSRRLSWHIAVSGDGQWTLAISCGTDKSRPDSLGTTSRKFELGQGRRTPRLRIMPGSFRSTRGFCTARAPRPRAAARASVSSEGYATPAARAC